MVFNIVADIPGQWTFTGSIKTTKEMIMRQLFQLHRNVINYLINSKTEAAYVKSFVIA